MPEPRSTSLDEITGVSLEGLTPERVRVAQLLQLVLPIAADLVLKASQQHTFSPLGVAASAALQSVSALMSVAAPRCNLASPPKEIEVKVNGQGDMVYRCLHSPAHEWDLSGYMRP